MSHSTFSNPLETALEREIIGYLAIGQYHLAIGSPHGVLLTRSETSVGTPIPKSTPHRPLSDVPPDVLGRDAELETAIAALQTHRTLEIYGQSGVGKAAFLQHLIRHPQVTQHRPDGVFYVDQPLALPEIVQHVFNTFYDTPSDIQRSIHEMRRAVRDRRAIIALDRPILTDTELNDLKGALPYCTLIVASNQKRGWSADGTIELAGLSLATAQRLIDRELSVSHSLRTPSSLAQSSTVELLWRLLEGNPQRLLQAVALMREERSSLEQLVHNLQTDDPIRAFTRLVLASLPKSQRWIVALLTAMGGIGLRAEQIAAMVGPPNPQPSLQALVHRYLIRQTDDRYFLASGLVDILQTDFNAVPWIERAVAYLIPWAEARRAHHEAILEEHHVLMYTLRWMMDQQHWRDGLRLICSIEEAFALGKQWEAWRQILRWSLQAAWVLEDEQTEAWATHQLGTLAFCQEDITNAYDILSEALKLRRANLGNELPTELTRHNLSQVKETLLPSRIKNVALRKSQRRAYATLAAIGVLTLFVSFLIGLALLHQLDHLLPKG
jgi:hypothetical protein